MTVPATATARRPLSERIGFALGPLAMVAMLLAPAPDGMPPLAWRTAAVTVLMAIWWITEGAPIPVTALVPLVALPMLGISSGTEAAEPYANPVVYLFLGGFVIAIAIEHSGLHRRMALAVMQVVGTEPRRLVGGMLISTAALSMWISNTAATMMMLPLATSILAVADRGVEPGDRDENFAMCLLLSTAWAATIGGMGTLIGTPPNALLAAFMRQNHGLEIGFGQWMLLGTPIVIVTVPIVWLLMTRVLFPIRLQTIAGGRELIDAERRALGPVSRMEWTVGIIAALTAITWIFRPLLDPLIPGLSDTTVAIAAALAIFLIPVGPGGRAALTWRQAEQLPWSVLILFGGGLSLSAAFDKTKLSAWIGATLDPLATIPDVLIIVGIVTAILFLSELTSNTATAATFLPIAVALAARAEIHPVLLGASAALAANCGFMMPVGTPPNAIVYATGRVSMAHMIRAGFVLNLVCVALISAFVVAFAPAVFGVPRLR